MTTVMLVHGAWHQPSTWRELEEELRGRGYETVTPALPSAGADPTGDAHDDAAVIRAALDAIDGEVVVVAHSYGGIPVTEAAAGVERVIYLAAFVPDVGESMYTMLGMPQPADGSGLFPLPEDPRNALYADVADADAAVADLVGQTHASFATQVTRAVWHDVPSTYVVTDLDRSLSVEVQKELTKRAQDVRHLASSHSPHLSMPAELAKLIDEIVSAD
ncbi:alpha/beta fold hydrolase [Actinoplanes sp. NPDC048988]|uniref:alpha/beta fold hydrolase n=1 Tax=Actinoplanes sp. NPDC048988 TaxID=3363901 RepID=UPI00371CCCF8